MRRGLVLPEAVVLVVAATATLLFASCSSSRLSNKWRDPSYTVGTMSRIFVIVVKKNAVLRQMWEDRFVSELSKHGVNATPSYRLFPKDLPDTNQVIEAADSRYYDGILIITRLTPQGNPAGIPAADSPAQSYDPWYRAYFVCYQREHRPGYNELTKVVRHEGELWTMKEGGRMIWSGVGEVANPGPSKPGNEEIVNLIVPELTNQGIIPGRK